MDRGRLTIKFDGLVYFQCADGFLSASGLEGERLFLRSPPVNDTGDEALPFFSISLCVFRLVPTRSWIAAAKTQGGAGTDLSSIYAEEITYGQSFSLVHSESGRYLSVAHSQPSENDPDCVSVVLLNEEAALSASCEFIFVSRYKLHSDGDKICREDEVLIRLALKPVFLHVSAPHLLQRCEECGDEEGLSAIYRTFRLGANLSFNQDEMPEASMRMHRLHSQNSSVTSVSRGAGGTNSSVHTTKRLRCGVERDPALEALTREYLDEVNGCEESGVSFIMHRYDTGLDRAVTQWTQLHMPRPLMNCGVPISFYHRERGSFLTTSVSKPHLQVRTTVVNDWETADLSVQFKHRTIQSGMTGINTMSGAEGPIHDAVVTEYHSASPSAGESSVIAWDALSVSSRSNAAALAAARARQIRGLVSVEHGVRLPYPVFAEEETLGVGDEMTLSEAKCSVSSMWVVEGENPCLAGPVRLRTASYRLKHVISGLYLAVAGKAVDAFFDAEDDDSDGVLASDSDEDSKTGGGEGQLMSPTLVTKNAASGVRETTLCLVPKPRLVRDLQRTLFTIEDMFATESSFLLEQDCLVIKNVLTEMYLATDRSIDGPNIRLVLQWQPSVADTIVALNPPQSLGNHAVYIFNHCQSLALYRELMQAVGIAKHQHRAARHNAAKAGNEAAKKEVEGWQQERATWAAVTAQRRTESDVDENILHRKMDIRLSRVGKRMALTMHHDYASIAGSIYLCQRTLISLIKFCSQSDEKNALRRDSLPIWANQRVLYDAQVFRLVVDIMLTHFAVLPGDPSVIPVEVQKDEDPSEGLLRRVFAIRQRYLVMHSLWCHEVEPSLPSLPLAGGVMEVEELLLPHHAEVHLVCRLAFRLLQMMVRKDSRLADNWCSFIRHFLALDGYRLHVVQSLEEMFTDNPDVPLWAMHHVAEHFINASKLVRRASYLNFLGVACVIRFKGIQERQEFVCQKLVVDQPELLYRFSMHGGELCVLTEPGGQPQPLRNLFDPNFPESSFAVFAELQIGLLARLVYDGATEMCYNVVKSIFPYEAVLWVLQTGIWTGRESVGNSSRLDVLRSHLLRLSFQCYTQQSIADPAIQLRLDTVLFGSSSLRIDDSVYLSGHPDSEIVKALKFVTLNLLRANPYYVQADVGRSLLMRAVVSIWFRLIYFRQYTSEEILEVIPLFLSQLDGTKDVVNTSAASASQMMTHRNCRDGGTARDRLELRLESEHLMRIREMVCQSLLAALNNSICRTSDEVIRYLYVAHTNPSALSGAPKPWSRKPRTAMGNAIRMFTQASESTALLAVTKLQEASCLGSKKTKKKVPHVREDGYEAIDSSESEYEGADFTSDESGEDNGPSYHATESIDKSHVAITSADVHAYLNFLTQQISDMFCPDRLIPLLLDVTRYESPPLTVQCMRLLVQMCVIKRSIAQRVLRVNTLPSHEVIRSFDRIHDVAVEISQRQAQSTRFSEGWALAIRMAEATLLDNFHDDEEACSRRSINLSEEEERLRELYSSIALAEKERRLFATSTPRDAQLYAEEEMPKGEEERLDEETQISSPSIRGNRVEHLWTKTVGATRMLIYSNTIKNRRRAMGLSEVSTVPLNLVIRAEIMAHWRIHETLLRMLPSVPPTDSAFFHIMKFFYFFTLSASNATILQTHITTLLDCLGVSEKTKPLCLNVIVSILGTMSDIDVLLSDELLAAFATRIDSEVKTRIPDNEFVRLLSAKVFSKETVSVVSRRRMMLILRDHGTLQVLTRPRLNPTVTELEFTSALVNLVCTVCGSNVSVLSLAQRMLPVSHILQIVMQRGLSNPLLKAVEGGEEPIYSTLAATTSFKLINPYIRALVSLYFASPEDNAENLKRRRANWTGDSQWWAINALFSQMLTQVANYIRVDHDTVGNRGLNVILTFRMFFLTSVPNCLAAFYINCFDLDTYTAKQSTIGTSFEDLLKAVTFFGREVLEYANALNLTVEEVVSYRRLVALIQHRGMQVGTTALVTLARACKTFKDDMKEWLSNHEQQLKKTLVKEHEERDRLGDTSLSDEADIGTSTALFREDPVSAQLVIQASAAAGLLLPGAAFTNRSIANVRTTLRGILKGNCIIPTMHHKPSTIALMVNSLLIRSIYQQSIRESILRILVAMRQHLFTPRTFVGLLNLFYNALDTVLHCRHSKRLEDIPLAGKGRKIGVMQLVEDEEPRPAAVWETAKAADKNTDASVHPESLAYALQVVFNDLGMMNVVISLSSIEDDVICYSALRLGVAILNGGNRSVQKSLLQYFLTHEEGFFHNIRDMFRKGVVHFTRINAEHQSSMLRRGLSGAVARVSDDSANMHLVEALRPRVALEHTGEGSTAFMSLSGWPRARGSGYLALLANIYRLLQLLCEGHVPGMQNYIRAQHDNLHSANMVHESMKLLSETCVFITPANLNVVSQGFDFVTEACQGPCRLNQECLINDEICGCIRQTLALLNGPCMTIGPHEEDPINNISPQEVADLKLAITRTLLALIEGCRDSDVYQKLFVQIPLADIEKEIMSVRPADMNRILYDSSFEHHPLAESLFNWLIYLNSIRPYAQAVQGTQIDAILERCSALSRYLGSIEISREDGLEQVFFRIPSICSGLTQERKDVMLWEVDRTSRVTKLADFLQKSDEIIFAVEMHHSFSSRVRYWTRFDVINDTEGSKWSRFWLQPKLCYNAYIAPALFSYELSYYETLSVIFAVLVNFILVLFEGVTFHSSLGRGMKASEEHVVVLLCILQTITCAIIFFIEVAVNFPIYLYGEYKEKQRFSAGKAAINLSMKEVYNGLSLQECIQSFLLWFTAQFRTFLLVMAALSWLVSPYFAAFNLMLLIYKIPTLRTFIAAITMNGKQLLLTSLLGLIMLYLFSIIGFLIFSRSFDPDDEGPGNTNCQTLLRCFTYILDNGLRAGGGVADAMHPWSWGDSDLVPRLLFDMFFFALVTVVFLNILFGIIIDTFGQMRDEKREKEQDMHGLCFICGLTADTLEKNSPSGFQSHIKTEHNMWMYLYFMHHLRRKDPSEFTGQESYANGKITHNKLDFFPEETCLSLQAVREEVDSASGSDDDNNDGVANWVSGASKEKSGLKELKAMKDEFNRYVKDLGNDATRMRSLLQQLELEARGTLMDLHGSSAEQPNSGIIRTVSSNSLRHLCRPQTLPSDRSILTAVPSGGSDVGGIVRHSSMRAVLKRTTSVVSLKPQQTTPPESALEIEQQLVQSSREKDALRRTTQRLQERLDNSVAETERLRRELAALQGNHATEKAS